MIAWTLNSELNVSSKPSPITLTVSVWSESIITIYYYCSIGHMSTTLHMDALQDSPEFDCCQPAWVHSQRVITRHCGEATDIVHLSLVLNPFILDFGLHFLRRVAETRKPRNCTVYMQPFNIAALLAIEDDKCLLAFLCTLFCGRCLRYQHAFRVRFYCVAE